MRSLMFLAVLLLIGIVAVGFYRGWFQLSTDTVGQRPSATITVDKDRIRADEKKAKEEVKGFGQKAKKRTGDRTDEG
jgi:hypothetical protein